MTLALPSEPISTFSAPVEAILSEPTAAIIPQIGVSLSTPPADPRFISLRPPVRAFKGHSVADPLQVRIRKYQEDNSLSFVAQAENLVAANPTSTIALARLAQTLAGEGLHVRSIETARRALAVDVKSEMDSVSIMAAKFVAARVLLSAGLSDEAENYLSDLSSRPGPWTVLYSAIAHMRGDNSLALQRLGTNSDPESALFRGFLLLESGRPQEAVKEFRSAGAEGSRNPGLLTNLAYGYATLGSLRKAIRVSKQAVQLAPRSRTLTLNLVGYLIGVAKYNEALDELERISTEWPSDIKLASATAHVRGLRASPEDVMKARSRLRQTISAHSFGETTVGLAELKVQLAHLEWQMGLTSKSALVAEIKNQLKAVDGASPLLVVMLIDLQHRAGSASEIRRMYDRLCETESQDSLLPVQIRLNVLERNYDAAFEKAKRFVEVAPMNPDSTIQLMSIQGQMFSDFRGAAWTGQQALRRFPGNWLIRNGVAFYSALDGRPDRAEEALGTAPAPEWPVLLATRGLIAFARGKVSEGMDWYDKAIALSKAKVNREEDRQEFESLARLYEWICLWQVCPKQAAATTERLGVNLPADWVADSNYLPLRRMAELLGLPWPNSSRETTGLSE